MNEIIQQIYDLVYSPVLTPYNLVDNAKLDNYDYVTFTKIESGILATMKCKIHSSIDTLFSYYFDKSDYLQTVTMKTDSGIEVIFDRNRETQKLKERFNHSLKKNLIAI